MLVLSRKACEQIQIGDDVVVTILQVKGQSVRIGIEAPRNVRILRSELPKHEPQGHQQRASSGEQALGAKPAPHAPRSARSNPATGNGGTPLKTSGLANCLGARGWPRPGLSDQLGSNQRIGTSSSRFALVARSISPTD